MIVRFERETRVARAPLTLRPGLQVGARAEAATRAGHEHASHAVLRILDLVKRIHQTSEHLGRDRIHDFGMVESYDADRSFDIEFCAFKFHGYLRLVFWITLLHYPN